MIDFLNKYSALKCANSIHFLHKQPYSKNFRFGKQLFEKAEVYTASLCILIHHNSNPTQVYVSQKLLF